MGGCPCPLPDALGTIPASTCDIQWDKINKMSICRQRIWESTTTQEVSTVDQIKTLSEWSADLSASDDTRQFITVRVGNFVMVPGAARTVDYDGNTTATGSYESTTVNFDYQGIGSDELEEMRKLTCEPTLFAIFFDSDKNIIHGLNGTVINGFELAIKTFTSTDMGQEELAGLIIAHGQLQLVDGWSSGTGVTISAPDDFNPLFDLVNS